MHKLAFARLCALALRVSLASAIATVRVQAATASVIVCYAGSLVTPMEGSIKAALQERGIDFQGEPGGSKELANLIIAGVRSPDVFISVNPSLVTKLGDRVASATTFAGTSLGIAWAPNSKYAALFDGVANDTTPLERALATPGLRIGRTDPMLDPKGQYTIDGMTMWLGRAGEQRILGDDENPSQIFPEQDLLARVDTGQADVGFFYRTEAIARNYRFVPLPGNAALTERITYTLALMKNALHPQAAKAFADFILTGPGRAILEKAGLTYLPSHAPSP
ncbi:MAG: substrate-binding domain-containing protein [Candidatus Cybelea sp.]